MASIWTGALTFGLVNIPVSLASAVRSVEKTSFRQLNEEDLAPIKYERVSSVDGEVVPWKQIVKGYEYAKGKYVVVTPEELAKVKTPSSKAVEMMDFVQSDEIDPRYFDTPYYLVPQKGGEKPYALLREALSNTSMVGIGKLTLRQKEHLVAVRPVGDALVLELMRFENELVPPEELNFPDAAQQKVRPQEIAMAEQLIGNLAEPFDPSKYHDEYEEKLKALLKAKLKGKKIPDADDDDGKPEKTKVIDLVARLQESLAASGAKKRGGRGTSTATAKKKPVKATRAKSARKRKAS
ncbi:MAG: repair protein [Gemmatimonadetes bacterium]|jgi:DNA end-binding protein Ku|nr:repair protein [Gemmatimonadota bacterium]